MKCYTFVYVFIGQDSKQRRKIKLLNELRLFCAGVPRMWIRLDIICCLWIGYQIAILTILLFWWKTINIDPHLYTKKNWANRIFLFASNSFFCSLILFWSMRWAKQSRIKMSLKYLKYSGYDQRAQYLRMCDFMIVCGLTQNILYRVHNKLLPATFTNFSENTNHIL